MTIHSKIGKKKVKAWVVDSTGATIYKIAYNRWLLRPEYQQAQLHAQCRGYIEGVKRMTI